MCQACQGAFYLRLTLNDTIYRYFTETMAADRRAQRSPIAAQTDGFASVLGWSSIEDHNFRLQSTSAALTGAY